MTPAQLLSAQKIISTKNFQSKFASMVRKAEKSGTYYNVVRNSESIGVFLPIEIWESLIEDMEALNSPRYLREIAESRKQHKNGQTLSIDEAFDV